MSSGEQRRVVVTLDELVAQLELIRAEAARLRDLLTQLNAEKAAITVAKESIDSILKAGQGSPVLFPLSTSPVALVEATPVSKDKVIVHLGADVYAKMDVSEALRLLTEEEGEYTRAIQEVSRRLAELENLQAQYEAVIRQAIEASRAREAKG